MTYPENDIKSEENEFDTGVARKRSTALSQSSAITITPSKAKTSAKPHCVKLTRNLKVYIFSRPST